MPRATVDRYAFMGRYRPFHLTFGYNAFGIHFARVDWIHHEDNEELTISQINALILGGIDEGLDLLKIIIALYSINKGLACKLTILIYNSYFQT